MIESINTWNDPKIKEKLVKQFKREERIKKIESLFRTVGDNNVGDEIKREYCELISSKYEDERSEEK